MSCRIFQIVNEKKTHSKVALEFSAMEALHDRPELVCIHFAIAVVMSAFILSHRCYISKNAK